MNTTQVHPYKVVEGWEQLPGGFTHQDCVGVGVDTQDNVYLFTRGQARVLVYSSDGVFLRSTVGVHDVENDSGSSER